MDEFQVRRLVQDENEKNSEGCWGMLCILICIGAIFYAIHMFGKDYTDLKERVERLEK